jgi:hypothetical protein
VERGTRRVENENDGGGRVLTRVQLERDRWAWAINAELERQARGHVKEEDALRNLGLIPKR